MENLPDTYPAKPYLASVLNNNIAWFNTEYLVGRSPLIGRPWQALSTVTESHADFLSNNSMYVSPWNDSTMAWVLSRATLQGLTGGEAMRDPIVAFTLKLFTSGTDFNRAYAGSDSLYVGTQDTARIHPLTAMAALQTAASTSGAPLHFSYHGAQERLALLLAMQAGKEGASAPLSYLKPQIDLTGAWGITVDLN